MNDLELMKIQLEGLSYLYPGYIINFLLLVIVLDALPATLVQVGYVTLAYQ